ncbi:unnamed protein product [Gongylonema pulchrum]|uniref:Ovule protein n=1 Tax=Gongylonema pulchrum TaxID=637853 RepID=A0A183F1C7_9BILA|nr:unnamed protein product [Gongylonema pulchrum]
MHKVCVSSHGSYPNNLQDIMPDISFDENPLFSKRLVPKGDLLDATDSSNRLLWYVEYKTINVEVLFVLFNLSDD